MRLRRSRLAEYKHCAFAQKKDNEGGTYTAYDSPSSFYAEMWAAGGKLQSEMYGSRLPNIRNLRLEGTYREVPGKAGKVSYEVTDGPTITVNDGICISEGTPDYRVVAILSIPVFDAGGGEDMILGEKNLLDALEELSKTDLYDAVSRGIKTVQAEAKSLCPVHDGELRGSIYTTVENSEGGIMGTCYTNKSYAAYVEFGTGPKGQANHEGISPDVAVFYSQSPWWIHESQVGRETAERYGWTYIDTPDGRFYRCSGQAAQPYMYPALKNNEQEIEKIFEEAVKKKK